MTAKKYQNLLSQLTHSLSSFSLVNSEGQLLFSKDLRGDCLATTRLVAFQIVKKYLRPQPLDLFILNDPENGGFSLTKIIFISALTDNLFLIWDEDFNLIDFKIPPTPLYEKSQKNAFVWAALVDAHPLAPQLKDFFEIAKKNLDLVMAQKEYVTQLSLVKNQNLWLKATQEIFELQMGSKATGSAEASYRMNPNQLIKLKLSIEEKQNVKSMTLDFTNTSLAVDYSCSSHVIESGLVHKMIQFYQIENFFSQAILDKIKVILPPKSIVSKARPQGEWNCEIQSICAQLCAFNLAQMNSQTRKAAAPFELAAELKIDLIRPGRRYQFVLDQKSIRLGDFEELMSQGKIDLIICQKTDQHVHVKFQVLGSDETHLQLRSKLFTESKDFALKVNGKSDLSRLSSLKAEDQVEIQWKIQP